MFYLSIYLSIHLSIDLPTYLSIHPSITQSINQSIHPSIHPSICVSIDLSIISSYVHPLTLSFVLVFRFCRARFLSTASYLRSTRRSRVCGSRPSLRSECLAQLPANPSYSPLLIQTLLFPSASMPRPEAPLPLRAAWATPAPPPPADCAAVSHDGALCTYNTLY